VEQRQPVQVQQREQQQREPGLEVLLLALVPRQA
jgi:hypothetical protein